ncbi:MAG: DUF1501 domain-containing protein [Planctomycetota bacterium]
MSDHKHLCSAEAHLSRRSLLGAGAGGAMLSALANRLAMAEETGQTAKGRPKSVILLWMQGAPSQLETFDPHVGTSIGGDVGKLATTVPGLEIADNLPRVAEKMHLGSLIRSVTTKEGDHERAIYNVKTGYRPDPTLVHPSIGSILCHEFPEALDLPRHISIAAQDFPARGGYLGPSYDAFLVDDPKNPVPDLKSRVEDQRFERRLSGLKWIEERFRRGRLCDLDRSRTLQGASTDAALRMMSSEQVGAFDVLSEPRAVLDEFGDTAFGRGCLAATRLIQVGARAIEVSLPGWDTHINNHEGQASQCKILDAGLSALLTRLEEQDLLDTTLVVCGGEFGRTPAINQAGGRDHWPHGFSMFLAGCGIRRGAVYGATSPNPKLDEKTPVQDVEDPVTVGDLHATILNALEIGFEKELETPIGRPLKRSEGKPIDSIIA